MNKSSFDMLASLLLAASRCPAREIRSTNDAEIAYKWVRMKVTIKDLAVNMELGNNGVEFDVYDAGNRHLGDLRIGRGVIEWCPGRTRRGHGVRKDWEELIDWFQNGDA